MWQWDRVSATYELEKHLKFNIETVETGEPHLRPCSLETAAAAGMLGSIDANAGDMLLGWDTDQFNTDIKEDHAGDTLPS